MPLEETYPGLGIGLYISANIVKRARRRYLGAKRKRKRVYIHRPAFIHTKMKRTIFIIDDDNDILEALEIFFKEAGFKVYTSFEGSGIENKTIRFKPDVILLDLLLSGNDGSEITLGLKSNERTKNIPVLLISAHPKANEKALKSGADGFLAKPFDLNELLRIVRTLLKEQALTTSPSSTG